VSNSQGAGGRWRAHSGPAQRPDPFHYFRPGPKRSLSCRKLVMMPLYESDLAYIQAVAYGDFAARSVPAIIERLRAAKPEVRRVLDVGCGAGVTTRALIEADFETLAIEPSEALLELARAAAPSATFFHARIQDVELPPVDAVLAVGEPLTYHAPDSDAGATLRRVFAKVAAALPPHGLFVFDLISAHGPALDAAGFRRGADWAILYTTREDRASRRLTREIETFRKDQARDCYRRAQELHHVRLFDEHEVASWLEQAGFQVEVSAAHGDVPLPPRRVAFVATRRSPTAED
jgi:SAM-dependent methyltransferase